jgi:Family of unknown function (DUF5677)
MVGRAVCTLVLSGFPTEAFGLSRTLIEIYFSLRYMGSRETQERVTTYIEYGTRVKKEWFDINAKYYPERKLHLSSSHDEEMKTAAKFKSRGQWTKHGGQAKIMALEPDGFETNDAGEPIREEFDYDALFFWTSHYVHVTVHGLTGHVAEPGRMFRVHPARSAEKEYARLALFFVVTFLTKITLQACRGMREDQPEQILQEMFRMMNKFIKK